MTPMLAYSWREEEEEEARPIANHTFKSQVASCLIAFSVTNQLINVRWHRANA